MILSFSLPAPGGPVPADRAGPRGRHPGRSAGPGVAKSRHPAASIRVKHSKRAREGICT
ncbi:hypothetical protein BN940_07146 [Castellaniella defragrans 65Phen]|uniref:Uncharacterized protein n=1 Tax=Castellaniella defragrans (strain DSM 12143 / CCUG 39792 / 65Phen) TaxID=1437824 RepID=W8X3P1_CASD6|nr:hypothetical protein BN940_07146 [Castellaniella defragrans 65Phen]